MKYSKASIYLFISLLFVNYSCRESKDLRVYAENLRVKNKIPGMVCAVVKADTILDMFPLGVRRHGYPDKIKLDDHFHIGSNTKSMTAFAAAHLIENKKIDWPTRFLDLFPDWKTQIDSQYRDITLGALLSHRARIQAFWTDVEFDSITINTGSKSEQRHAFNLYALNRKPITPDTLGYLYSNAGYTIASQMLEKASNMTWEELMLQIFKHDLNLDIGFSWPNKNDETQPWGHRIEKRKVNECPPDDEYNLDWLEPGGDVNISVIDYCKFIQLNLQGLSGQDNYLKSSTYSLLHNDPKGPIYAYGWADFLRDGRRFSYHAGSAGTFFASTTIDRSEGIAYIIMMNGDSSDGREMVVKIREKMKRIYDGTSIIDDN